MKLSELVEMAVAEYLMPPNGTVEKHHCGRLDAAVSACAHAMLDEDHTDSAAAACDAVAACGALFNEWRRDGLPMLEEILGSNTGGSYAHHGWLHDVSELGDSTLSTSKWRPMLAVDHVVGRVIAAKLRGEGR